MAVLVASCECVAVLVASSKMCGRSGSEQQNVWPFWSVAVLVCGRFDQNPVATLKILFTSDAKHE